MKSENRQSGGGLFRKAAMSRMSAGEHVDELLRVSGPSDYIFTGTLAAIAIIVIAWSFLGRIPVMVMGTGLIQPEDGIVKVLPHAGGIIWSDVPAEGARLKKGDLIVKINSENVVGKFKSAVEGERLANEDYETQKLIYSITSKMSKKTDDEIVKLMESVLEKLEVIYNDRKKDYGELKELQKKGYVTKTELLSAEQAMASALQNLHNVRIQLAQEKVAEQSDLIQKKQALRDAEKKYIEAKIRLGEISGLLKEGEINAPMNGQVSECAVKRGDFISGGTPVCLIVGEGPAALIYLFFKTGDAKRIEAGNEVKIEAESFPSDMYGKLVGRVTEVEPLPANEAIIAQSCGYSEILTKRLLSGPPVSRVTVKLLTEEKDGRLIYKKAGGSQPFTITTGMICSGSAITENRVPVTLAVPALKKWLGLS